MKGNMVLGWAMRSVASLMLKMVKSLSYGAFDHGFGSAAGDIPHIATSLYQGVDRFVITEPGDVPPTLGVDLPESSSVRKKRRSSTSNLIIDVNKIYSLSYHTMYIELLNWQVVRLPGFKSISLEGYWGRQPFYIPCYTLNNNHKDGLQRQCDKTYHFNVEIERVWSCKNGNPTSWPEDDPNMNTTSDSKFQNQKSFENLVNIVSSIYNSVVIIV